MRIVQTTGALKGWKAGEASIEEMAGKLRDAGYRGVDISFTGAMQKKDAVSRSLSLPDWRDRMKETREKLLKMDMPAVQSHAPFFNMLSPDLEGLDERMEMVNRSVEASGILGIPWVVMHPGTDYGDNRFRVNLKKNIEFFKPVLETAAFFHTGIAIENLFDTFHYPQGVAGSSEKTDRRGNHRLIPMRRFGANPEELMELADALSGEFPNVGICWDFGHANEAGLDHVKALKLLGRRIKVLHINDNLTVYDDHMTPFCGSVPWEQVFVCLKQIGYEGNFTYENIKFYSRLPEGLLDAALRYGREVAEYLVGVYEMAEREQQETSLSDSFLQE